MGFKEEKSGKPQDEPSLHHQLCLFFFTLLSPATPSHHPISSQLPILKGTQSLTRCDLLQELSFRTSRISLALTYFLRGLGAKHFESCCTHNNCFIDVQLLLSIFQVCPDRKESYWLEAVSCQLWMEWLFNFKKVKKSHRTQEISQKSSTLLLGFISFKMDQLLINESVLFKSSLHPKKTMTGIQKQKDAERKVPHSNFQMYLVQQKNVKSLPLFLICNDFSDARAGPPRWPVLLGLLQKSNPTTDYWLLPKK